MKSIIIFLCIFSSLSYGSDDVLKFEMSLVDQNNIYVGESFRALLKINQELASFELDQKEKEGFKRSFHISNVEFVKLEQGSTIIGLLMVYKEFFSYPILSAKINGKNSVITILDSKKFQKNTVKKIKEFNVLETKFQRKWYEEYKEYVFASALIIFILFLFLIFRLIKSLNGKSKKRHQMLETKKKWKSNFEVARARSDFERIYAARDEWGPLIVGNQIDPFITRIGENLYIKEWPDEVIEELKEKAIKILEYF
jgi:hypothetical protein